MYSAEAFCEVRATLQSKVLRESAISLESVRKALYPGKRTQDCEHKKKEWRETLLINKNRNIDNRKMLPRFNHASWNERLVRLIWAKNSSWQNGKLKQEHQEEARRTNGSKKKWMMQAVSLHLLTAKDPAKKWTTQKQRNKTISFQPQISQKQKQHEQQSKTREKRKQTEFSIVPCVMLMRDRREEPKEKKLFRQAVTVAKRLLS